MPDNNQTLAFDDESKQMTTDAQTYLDHASGMAINTITEAGAAASELTRIKKKHKELEEKRFSMTRPIDDSKKRIMEFFRGPTDFLKKAEKILKNKIADFHEEQERIAQKAADEEFKRLERNAAKRAKTAEKNGDVDRAEEIIQEGELEAAAASASVVQINQPKTGVSTRVNWKIECTDIKALALAVAEGKAPPTLLSFNQVEANKYAKAVKDSMPAPAGTRIYKDRIVSSRSA